MPLPNDKTGVNPPDTDHRGSVTFRYLRIGIGLFLFLAIGFWLVYQIFGEDWIRYLYQMQSPRHNGRPLLNPNKSVEYYLRYGDQVVDGCLVYVVLLFCVVRLVYGWIYAPAKNPRILILCGLFFVASTYLVNADRHMIFGHGGIHAGMVYQILNCGLPPDNPLLAGQPLRYPWGFHVCAAAICRVFQITPGWSFVVINLLSLFLCVILIARIARCLIRDTAVQVYAVIVSLFTTTVISRPILSFLSHVVGYELEWRAQFAGQKFIRINGAPPGLVFFVLLVYSLIRVVQGHHTRRHVFCLWIAAVGCGLVYPLMYPALGACGGMVIFYLIWEGIRFKRFRWIPILQILIPLGLSMILVVPFLRLISGTDADQKIQILNPQWILRNGFNVALVLGPIVAVIILEFRYFQSRWNSQAATVLMLVILACLGCYVGLHMFNEAEYKNLILTDIGVGILGGLAVSTFRNRVRSIWMFVLLLAFASPVILNWFPAIRPYSWSRTPLLRSQGTTLSFVDPIQEELQRWIRDTTPVNSVFMDTKLEIPYSGQRSLYLAWTGIIDPDIIEGGYNMSMRDFLELQSGYSPSLLEHRRRILHQMYSPDESIPEDFYDEARRFEFLYVVVRDPSLFAKFSSVHFETVFTSSNGQVRVYRPRS